MTLASLTLALAVLWPQPRQAELAPVTPLRLPVEVVAQARLDAPARLMRKELAGLFGQPEDGAGGTLVRLELASAELPRAEEFEIIPDEEGVLLRAHDAQGMFWAVHALVDLLGQARRTAAGFEADIPRVHDWPDTPFRAFMIQGAWTHEAEEYERNLELLARRRIRFVALEFGPQVVLDLDPTIAEGGRFTKARAREIIEYGRSLGIQPIAYLNMLGHLERAYEKPPYTLHGGIDIRNDEAYEKFVYPILSEMLEVYGPVEYFHCGMDEAWELFAWLSKEGEDVTGLIARHIQRINDFLKARGVKTVIWHDMLIAPSLREEIGGPVGPANGGPPQNTAGALASVPKDVILNYWFYDPVPAYPAMDYLRDQGFTVWASPWQTPFALTRYANARQVPVMGTLWSGPPNCFGSPVYSPVTALHAQAAWNASLAPDTVSPEAELTPQAQRATNSVLWRRPTLTFPGDAALLLSPVGARRVSWPREGIEQHSGVPLDTGNPLRMEPLPTATRSLGEGSGAARVRLPGGRVLPLDGVNSGRGEDQLILYAAPRERTGTNIYGTEVSVSAGGVVLETSGYGGGNQLIPAGGFVLSAHSGPRSDKSGALGNLRAGDSVAVLDAQGEWVGGSAPTLLLVELPGGQALRVDAENLPRDADQLVLYRPGFGETSTRTNPFGVEVVVVGGQVAQVLAGKGDARIPAEGYVLSAHEGEAKEKARALGKLKVGDPVRLMIDRGGLRGDLDAALAERRRVFPLNATCKALFLAMTCDAASSRGTPVGQWVVGYADGTSESIPVRYGREVLGASGDSLPQRTDDPVWLVDEPPLRCLVVEWPNPRPAETVREISFEPAPSLLEIGASIVAATAAG